MQNTSKVRLLFSSTLAVLMTLTFLEICSYLYVRVFHLKKEKASAAGARVNYPKWWRYSSVLGLVPKPNLLFVYDGAGAWLGTDNYGFCHNGDPGRKLVPKQKDVYRIFVLGGSTVWGKGIPSNEDTIPAQVEKMLNADTSRHFKIEVINAGMRGWMSYQEFCYLTKDLIYYEPDMVIVLDGINDFYYPQVTKNLPPGLSPPLAEMERMFNISEENRIKAFAYHTKGIFRSIGLPFVKKCKSFYTFIKERSSLVYMMRKLIYRIESLAGIKKKTGVKLSKMAGHQPSKSVSCAYYIQNLKNIIGVCRINGIDCVILFQPTLASGQKIYITPEEEKLLNEIDDSFQLADAGSKVAEYYGKVSEEFKRLKSVYQDERVYIEDLSGIFSSVRTDVYNDAAHYNAEGAKALAGRISQIVDEGFIKRK